MQADDSAANETVVTAGWGIVLIAAALGLNVGSNLLIPLFNGLLFLDMLGTATIALAMGPWWAALVGFLTNLILGPMQGHAEYPDFAIVNVYGGIVWGLAAQGRLAPFRQTKTVKRGAFLSKLLVLGVLGGLLCAAMATYIRADFSATVTQTTVDRLPQTHAAERLMKDAVNCHYLGRQADDPTYKFMVFDFLTIIPDKVISVAFAAFVLFHLPWFASRRADKPRGLATQRLSAWAFAVGFLCLAKPLWSWRVNAWQAMFWWIPEVLAVAAALRPNRVYAISRGAPIQGAKLKVDAAYKDILGIVGLWYSIAVAWSLAHAPAASASSAVQPCPQATSPANLARDGIGIFAFLTIFGFVPLTLREYLRSGSEQAWRDGHETPRPPAEPPETERQGAT